MNTIETTETFDAWFDALRDPQAAYGITMRIRRAEPGNFGDYAPVGEGVPRCASITGRATGFISRKPGERFICCSQAAINRRRKATSKPRRTWHGKSGIERIEPWLKN